MHFRATVQKVTGNALHLRAGKPADNLEQMLISNAKTVEIVEQDGAVFLLRLDGRRACISETWHETVEAAKEQARFEFGIEDDDWEDVEP
jgi:hypothetical protein